MTTIAPQVHVPESVCTKCGFKPDAASAVNETGKQVAPTPGDATLCATCGHAMVFDDNLMLRDPTTEEARLLYSDPRVLVAQYVIRKTWLEKTKH